MWRMDSGNSSSSRPAGRRANAGYARGQSSTHQVTGRLGTEDADNSTSTGSKRQVPDWVHKAHTLDDDNLIAKLVKAPDHESSKYYDYVVQQPTSLIDFGAVPPSVGTKYLDKRYSWGFETGDKTGDKSGLLVLNHVSGKHIPVESAHLITCYDSVCEDIFEAVTTANAPFDRNEKATFQSAIKSVIHALATSFTPLQTGPENITGITTYLLRDIEECALRVVWHSLDLERFYDYRKPSKVKGSQTG